MNLRSGAAYLRCTFLISLSLGSMHCSSGPPPGNEEAGTDRDQDTDIGEVPGCEGPWKDEAALAHGKQLWVHHYNEILGYGTHHFDGVAVSKGGVVVAAAQPGDGDREHLLLAYSSVSGEPLWSLKGTPSGYLVRKMMAAHDHGIVLAGIWNPKDDDHIQRGGRMSVRKIDDAGNTLWTTQLSWTIDRYGTQGEHIAVGPDGTIVVAGRCVDVTKLTGSDLCTAQFSADGEEQWVRHYNAVHDSPQEISEETINAVNVASDGTVFVFGVLPPHAGGGISGNEGFLRYSNTGELLEVHHINTKQRITRLAIHDMAVTASDALAFSYIHDTDHTSPYGKTVLLAGISVFNWQGERLWQRHEIGPRGATTLHPRQLVVGKNGDFTLSSSVFGCEPDSEYSERIWLSRFNPQGQPLWSRLWIPPEPDPEHHYSTVVNQIAVDDEGRTYLAGVLRRTPLDHDSPRPRAFVVAFGP